MSENYMKLHILAFGLGLGVLSAFMIFFMGLFAMGGYGTAYVTMIGSVYIGYKATFLGSLLGAFWGFFEGFIIGVFWGWLYNYFIRCGMCGMCGKCKSDKPDEQK